MGKSEQNTHSGGEWRVNGPMFMGEFQHTIDPKGRLIIPNKFRTSLGERFVAAKGLDNCLFVYPMPEWQEFEQELRGLPLTNADARAFVRFFFSGATECELDKQGRILLPANLRDYAKLEKDVVVLGAIKRVEIWSKENWENYNSKTESNPEEIAEKIAHLGLRI